MVSVEIVARKKGCVLCDLAIGILEEISSEFAAGIPRWEGGRPKRQGGAEEAREGG